MRTTALALQELHHALEVPPQPGASLGTWRWSVRQRMAGVRDVLVNETAHHEDEWLAARGGSVLRERNTLLGRLSTLGPQVLESESIDDVRAELQRLLCDIRHHVQRLHDLAYDEVELELGGSE
jgi:hypothetical protein